MPLQRRASLWLLLALLLAACLLSGCSDGDPAPPAGLSYGMTSATYQAGAAIVPNRPTASGGAIDGYTVAPSLPAGLALDAATGVIAGTPTAVSPATVYTVTARNRGGSATARMQIEVRDAASAPATLRYREPTVTYTAGLAIADNTPTSSGGPITDYGIAPALPAGLALDPQTGIISGTPASASPASTYTVTGSNAAGSASATLQIAVQSAVAAPASLGYASSPALYVTTEPIVPNTPVATGGPISTFAVSPALPAGLSLNASTGVISGTPAALQSAVTYTVTGSNIAGSVQAQLQIVVTARGAWSTMAPMPTPVHYATATRLNDGSVLVAGGYAGGTITNLAWRFDPVANTWDPATPMLYSRNGHAATLLPDGRVLVTGGETSALNETATTEIYAPDTNTWTAAGDMSEARQNHSATLLPNGKVLVAGGYVSGSIAFRTTMDLFDPAFGWTSMATPLASPRAQHSAQLLPDGNVLLIGGTNSSGALTTSERIAIDDSGTATAPSPVRGSVTVATRLADGSFLALADGSANAYRYNPSNASWTTSTLRVQRMIPTMTLLADGRVLVAGGTVIGGGAVRTASTEIYHPDTNSWIDGSAMAVGRGAAHAVRLADDSVLMIGGFDGTTQVPVVERFQP